MAFGWSVHKQRGQTRARGLLRRYLRDRRGNIAAITALLIVPLVGLMGIATETSGWFLIQRAMQNAADSAVLAAATNANTATIGGIPSYQMEAKSVAAQFGFTAGVNNTTVTPVNGQTCPSPLTGSTCYKVTISRNVPINLTKIVGYTGTGGTGMQAVTASAMAGIVNVPVQYCLLALDNTAGDTAIDARGAPSANLEGCNIMSNSGTNCSGHDLNAGLSTSVSTTSNDCGTSQKKGAATVSDPYTSLASKIPTSACEASNVLSTPQDWSGSAVKTFCGDVSIPAGAHGTANVVTVKTPASGTVMVIKNGTLNIASNATLQTLANSGVAIVFTGASTQQYPTGGGTLDIAAPTPLTSDFHGVALYKDPASAGATFTYTGNSPTWKITGLIYFPKDNITFKGAVNKSSNGYSCMAVLDWTTTIKGTGDIFYRNAQTECSQAGLTPPADNSLTRVSLIQ